MKISDEKYEMIGSSFSSIINPECVEYSDDTLKLSETNDCIIEKITLEENSIYPILLKDVNEVYMLYCFSDYEDSYKHINIINTKEITIGSKDNNSIVFENPLVSDTHVKLYKFKEKWIIENYNSVYGIFVNDFPVYNKPKNIFNGDTIFIMGLELIMIKDSFYINDYKKNISFNDKCFEILDDKDSLIENESYEDEEIKLKNNNEFFSRSPRIVPPIVKEKVTIDPPPELTENRQRPMMLAIGSSVAMGLLMLTSLTTTIQNMINKTATTLEIVIGFLTTAIFLFSMVALPIIDVKWDRKANKKYEQKRQKRYKEYLNKKQIIINKIKDDQKKILFSNYLAADKCVKLIYLKKSRLWERDIKDKDFLSVRLGLGKVPLQIESSYPQEKFAMVDDNLLVLLNSIIEDSKYIENAPVTISLSKNKITSLITDNNYDFNIKYIKSIILQLVTFQSYDNLKLIFLTNEKNSKNWEFVKLLPHVWDDSKHIRFFADNIDDMNNISKFLMEELSNIEAISEKTNTQVSNTHYLIITDNYKQIEGLSFINSMLNSDKIRASLFCISNDLYNVPSNCKTFIDIRNKDTGILYEDGMNSINQTEIKIEPLITIFFDKISQILLNIPIKLQQSKSNLADNYTFLEMYNAGTIEQLEVYERWRKNDSTLSLKAPIGIDQNGVIIYLDAHEKFHGPHGLIAGSTGSGKSEFIITYILSLALNYHPDDVTFLLIDYKGGGLAGAFQKNGIKLPHLVGTITNIDKNGLERSLTSIQSELRRRQVIFNKARNLTNEGTIDIYKYQKLYHEGIVDEPISHLFIICDEFAELKQQQLEFMDELVSVSRIGRSLGVHLILATQKPSGVVDDQIRSNSKFAICLKVQDTSDSQDVIQKPDAAFLKNPGQFYLKVGQNEYYTLGQSGWAGASYIPSNFSQRKLDTSVEFISNIGLSIKKVNESKNKNNDQNKEQLTCLLDYIYKIAQDNNIHEKQLWLENIPEDIYISDLKEKYNVKRKENEIKAIIGEYDNPSDQKQGLVEIDLMKKDNILIYGNEKSGKETMLSTITYDLMMNYTPEQVQMYILDFGTESLKIFRKSPHIGDIVFMNEDEKIDTFFEFIKNMIEERKQILSDYNGDYNLYLSKGNIMPIIAIILNNYEAFNENYEDKYDDLFLMLTREGTKCGIEFIVTTATTSMRYRTVSNFNKKFALQLNNDDDYYSIFDNIRKKRPAHMFGRGIMSIDNNLFEFQTAKISDYKDYNDNIEKAINHLNEIYGVKAVPLPSLPDKIETEDLYPYLTNINSVPIGIIKKNLNVYKHDFKNNFITIISSNNMTNILEFSYCLFDIIEKLENVKISILDTEKSNDNLKKSYNNFIKEINKDIKSKDETFTICAIIGIEKLIDEGLIDELEFNDFLNTVKDKGKHSFIIIEKSDKLENHLYDDWYSEHINQENGIWISNGVEDQTIITTEFSLDGLENKCGKSFGYVVNDGNPTLIKLLGLKEGDENE